MSSESLTKKKLEKENQLRALVEKTNQLDKERQDLLQEVLRLDGEIRLLNELISSGEK
jgi:hypothetical protein